MKHVVQRHNRPARDERGAILIMAAVGIIVMVVASALSIDIGRQALAKRTDQSVADLAALDAARDSSTATQRAQDSARRNGFDPSAPGHTLTVEVGKMSGGVFQPGAGTDAVRVTATSVINYIFVGGQKILTAQAVAANQGKGSFSIGSNLATITTDQSALLNPIIGQMINPVSGSLNLSLVGWQGLASGSLSLAALQTQLLSAGLDVGSVDKLMSTDLTLVQLFNASAQVLTNQGMLAQANTLGSLALASGSAHMKLGDLFTLNQGDPGSALNTTFNAFDFVTGAAEVANGTSFVNVPNVTVTVPNVSSVSISMQVIEGPKYCLLCSINDSVKTAQVHLTVTPNLNLPVSVPGLPAGVTVTGALPVDLQAAKAIGTLENVTCTTPQSIEVGVDPQPVNLTSTGTVHVVTKILGVNVPLLDAVESGTSTVTGSHGDLTFTPPASGPQHYGSTFVGLQSLPYSTGNVTVLGSLPVSQTTITNAVSAALGPAQGPLDTKVVTPLFQALGVQVGSADVTGLGYKCGVLGLVK